MVLKKEYFKYLRNIERQKQTCNLMLILFERVDFLNKENNLEDSLNRLKKGKRINCSMDDIAGLAINTRLPGTPEPTIQEKEEMKKRIEEQRKMYEERRKKFFEEHPTPNVQMDVLFTAIKELEEKFPNQKEFNEMKRIVLKTKEDYLNYYHPEDFY